LWLSAIVHLEPTELVHQCTELSETEAKLDNCSSTSIPASYRVEVTYLVFSAFFAICPPFMLDGVVSSFLPADS
jgi:hypothetical protein